MKKPTVNARAMICLARHYSLSVIPAITNLEHQPGSKYDRQADAVTAGSLRANVPIRARYGRSRIHAAGFRPPSQGSKVATSEQAATGYVPMNAINNVTCYRKHRPSYTDFNHSLNIGNLYAPGNERVMKPGLLMVLGSWVIWIPVIEDAVT